MGQRESVFYREPPPPQTEEVDKRCWGGHKWGGLTPTVDSSKHEIQNPTLIGTPCDCQKLTFGERVCTCGTPKWEIYYYQYNG